MEFPILENSNHDLFFGQYTKPLLLKRLEKYQDQGGCWEDLGFYIEYDHHYSMTPLDVIPFAGTGGNGIHFGFLTDFGNQKDLANAPIVCVSPTNDPPVKLIARNLKDFLRIVVVVGLAELLAHDYESDNEIASELEEWDEGEEPEERKELIALLKSDFNILPLDSIVEYIQTVRDERNALDILQDHYEIGILYHCPNDTRHEYAYESLNLVNLQTYLNQANKCERLLFYRNATYQYMLSSDDELTRHIIQYLIQDNLIREAKILYKQY